MSRRRLTVISSSSSDDEQDAVPGRNLPLPDDDDDDIESELREPTLHFETVTLNSSNPHPIHVEDDDVFVDVSENLSSPSPPRQPSVSIDSIAMNSTEASPLPESVSSSSSRISTNRTTIPDNVSSLLPRASAVTSGFTSLPTESPVDSSSSRISSSNAGITNNVSSVQSIPFQIFTASTVASTDTSQTTDCPIEGSLRDIGLRLRRNWLDSCIHGLENAVADFSRLDHAAKAKLCFEQFLLADTNQCGSGVLPANVHDMHLVDLQGPFILQVDEIVNISCPLKGRYQSANAGHKRCLKLSMTDGVQRVFGMEYRPIKDLEVLAPAGLKVAVCNVQIRHGLLMLVPEVFRVLGGHVEVLEAARQRLVTEVNKPARGRRTRSGEPPPLETRATNAAWPSERILIPPQTDTNVPHTEAQEASDVRIPQSDRVFIPPQTDTNVPHTDAQEASDVRIPQSDRVFIPPQTDTNVPHTEAQEASDAHIPQSDIFWDNFDDVRMVDSVEQAPRTADEEVPFSYLSNLFAKLVPMEDHNALQYVRGKIKCLITGVKGFQFKQMPTYELQVYVDDGSRISEIIISHDVVQDMIGHSPQEVTAVLDSLDKERVADMRKKLKQFQYYLANFEGMMVVEINGGSDDPVPVVNEINQGCTVSDAWLLLRRLRAQQPGHDQFLDEDLDPIEISP